jgi:hypothetical protein
MLEPEHLCTVVGMTVKTLHQQHKNAIRSTRLHSAEVSLVDLQQVLYCGHVVCLLWHGIQHLFDHFFIGCLTSATRGKNRWVGTVLCLQLLLQPRETITHVAQGRLALQKLPHLVERVLVKAVIFWLLVLKALATHPKQHLPDRIEQRHTNVRLVRVWVEQDVVEMGVLDEVSVLSLNRRGIILSNERQIGWERSCEWVEFTVGDESVTINALVSPQIVQECVARSQ